MSDQAPGYVEVSHLLSQGPSQLPVSTEGSHGRGDRMDGWMDGPTVAKFMQNAGLSRVSISLSLWQVPLQGPPLRKGGVPRRLEGKRFQAGGRAVGERGGWREGGRAGPISEEALQGADVKQGRSEGWVLPEILWCRTPALPLPSPAPPYPPSSWVSEDGQECHQEVSLIRGAPGGACPDPTA